MVSTWPASQEGERVKLIKPGGATSILATSGRDIGGSSPWAWAREQASFSSASKRCLSTAFYSLDQGQDNRVVLAIHLGAGRAGGIEKIQFTALFAP